MAAATADTKVAAAAAVTGTKQPHVLIVGGTGMLADAAVALCDGTRIVSVLSRSVSWMDGVKKRSKFPNHFVHLKCDYSADTQLVQVLSAATQKYGRFSLAIVWIHSNVSTTAPVTVAGFVDGPYFHVLGSDSASAPETTTLRKEIEPKLGAGFKSSGGSGGPGSGGGLAASVTIGCSYHEVILGFINEQPPAAAIKGYGLTASAHKTRWLTWEEISAGVLLAITTRKPRSIVGTVEPWSLRPKY